MEKEVLEYLGFDPEKVKTIDDFKANFQAGYLNKSALENQKSPEYRELLPKFVGKVAGAVDTRIRSTLKKIGVELTDDELQDRSNIEDIAEYAISKVHQTTQGKLKELQEQAGQGVDERFKQLEQMNIKLKEKADQQAEMIKSLGTEKETLLKNFEGEKKIMDGEPEKIRPVQRN